MSLRLGSLRREWMIDKNCIQGIKDRGFEAALKELREENSKDKR